MSSYNYEAIKKNIFHELNKMLVALTKDDCLKDDSPSYHKITCSNEMVKYYLKFPFKIREEMANILTVSEKTLHRFYEDPLKILDNHATIMELSLFLSHSYQHMIELFFNNSNSSNFKNKNESIIMKEILKFEEQRGVEERRDIARVIHLLLSLNIPTSDFSDLNLKMINKKFYTKESIKRLHNFIDNV